MWRPAITKSPLYESLNNVKNPFEGFDIFDASVLDENGLRENCAQCGRSRMWFCYECRSPLPSLAGRFPQVKLPFIVDIIKHGKELNGKSTGVQASILSKEVNLFVYPNIPKYEDPSKVLLIFPCKEQFDDVCRQRSVQLGTEEKCVLCEGRHIKFAFNRVILIDSTWCQTKKILLDDRIASLPYSFYFQGGPNGSEERILAPPTRTKPRVFSHCRGPSRDLSPMVDDSELS
ncbi:DTW domain-containing protein 1-like isoform X2 [Varroa jacobsoni]|uniref:tRNA-uridine aminocarboxypropyltransferase 1 n=1 Tax=Varroa destructor TaxID=109461 RepID=A0A7M7J5Z1_VARDE|nr:DTW domain-containing protein 1-like isoform X2 [Varroa destructor]XP_022710264.1 DTW domain-containing protein 1-like isoform X2 [Varroa jacobsoni]